ncbi:hypothetical protein BDR22DRAFT_68880 [Usnea florida]
MYPRDLGRVVIRLSSLWRWFRLWHAGGIVCASSHIHWCVDCSADHESVLSFFEVGALAVVVGLFWIVLVCLEKQETGWGGDCGIIYRE